MLLYKAAQHSQKSSVTVDFLIYSRGFVSFMRIRQEKFKTLFDTKLYFKISHVAKFDFFAFHDGKVLSCLNFVCAANAVPQCIVLCKSVSFVEIQIPFEGLILHCILKNKKNPFPLTPNVIAIFIGKSIILPYFSNSSSTFSDTYMKSKRNFLYRKLVAACWWSHLLIFNARLDYKTSLGSI